MNESKRSAGWKPNYEAVEKVEDKIKNDSWGLKIRVSAIRKKSRGVGPIPMSIRLHLASSIPQDAFASNYTTNTDDTVDHFFNPCRCSNRYL